MPTCCAVRDTLERHYRDMQDIEFTVQQNKLYMLQTRNGKRTAAASLRIAVEMAKAGLIDRDGGDPARQSRLARPAAAPDARPEGAAHAARQGPARQPGRRVAAPSCSAPTRRRCRAAKGEAVILVRIETSPEDIHGMHAARGILTTRGGMTSHAAVVARGMGRPCVAGAGGISGRLRRADARRPAARRVRGGETITLDGATGEVFVGAVADDRARRCPAISRTLMEWADEVRRMRVRTNAETPLDAETARKFGAEGIGLCRTEHMFFDPERIGAVRQMIMAQRRARPPRGARQAAAVPAPGFHRAVPHHGRAAGDDPPARPAAARVPAASATPSSRRSPRRSARISTAMRRRAAELAEANPMLGHRGCRLGITYPEIYEMQARAIFEGALAVAKETGQRAGAGDHDPAGRHAARTGDHPRAGRQASPKQVFAEAGADASSTSVGTMIELPRAALIADKIAEVADFFSFGTNDLTQTAFGLSRDDAGKFLPHYVEAGILPKDPFVSIDVEGVGALVRIAAEKGRGARKPGLKLGICGEHGGDPASIAFCEEVGLDYVSCSPYRVPVARLAAAQAALGARRRPHRLTPHSCVMRSERCAATMPNTRIVASFMTVRPSGCR